MQKNLAETRYICRDPEWARQECQRPHFGNVTPDTSDRFSAVQNDFPVAIADEATELRKGRPVDGVASFPGFHLRRRAFIPIRFLSPLFENFVVGPDQCLPAEQVVNARESRCKRQVMFGRMKIARKHDEEPAPFLQDTVAFPQGILHILHVLKNIVGQYGVQAVVLKRQFFPYRHAIIGWDFPQACELRCSGDEFLLHVDARKKAELIPLGPGCASPARETTQIESNLALQERGQVYSEIVVPGIGELVSVLALGGREHDRLALRFGPIDENRVPKNLLEFARIFPGRRRKSFPSFHERLGELNVHHECLLLRFQRRLRSSGTAAGVLLSMSFATCNTLPQPISIANSRGARSRTRSLIRRRRLSSSRSRQMRSASSDGFPGTTRKPSSPSFTKSGIAPTAAAMTGSPAAMASGITRGKASVQDGTTIIFEVTNAAALSRPSREPRKLTRAAIPRLSASARTTASIASRSATPTSTKRASGWRSITRGIASNKS